jgi:hypothetical protein
MDEEKAFLTDWITHFLKNRNMIFKSIESMEPHPEYELHVRHKTKDQYVLAAGTFTAEVLKRLTPEKHLLLVGFHTESNLQFIVENWKRLAELPNLTIYTVNPLSEPDKKWVICPHVHQRICDSSSLKTGLRAMFETVQPLSEQAIKTLLKQKP